MTDVRITAQPDSEMLRVAFRYDPSLVSLIKDVSPGLRSYDGETKSWAIHESVIEQVIDAMAAAGHQVIAGDGTPARTPAPTAEEFFNAGDDRAYVKAMAAVILEIIDKVPAKSRHKVFRAVARGLYPDLYAR